MPTGEGGGHFSGISGGFGAVSPRIPGLPSKKLLYIRENKKKKKIFFLFFFSI